MITYLNDITVNIISKTLKAAFKVCAKLITTCLNIIALNIIKRKYVNAIYKVYANLMITCLNIIPVNIIIRRRWRILKRQLMHRLCVNPQNIKVKFKDTHFIQKLLKEFDTVI
jgi:hypothetical protein